jgi:type II secretory pathway component PulK
MRIRHSDRATSRTGAVLIAVLVVVVMLSLAAFQFSELMYQEYAAAQSSLKSVQARACADSGIAHFAAMVSDKTTFTGALSSNPFDNESAFSGQTVMAGGSSTGRFSIVAPIDKDDVGTGQTFRFGAIDEAGKINPNALLQLDSTGQVLHDALMKLPNMTDDIADSIVNWISATDSLRPNGANNSYYSALTPPYRCKNGPLDSIEELLLVRGVTPRLLFGTDFNRNGIQDPGEDEGGGWDPGWAPYLTVYSRERNIDNDGNARVYLNDSDLKKSYEALVTAVGQALADFIILYRTQTNSGSSSQPQSGGGTPATITMQGANGGGMTIIITVVTAPAQGQKANSQQIADQVNKVLNSTSNQPRAIASRYELIGASVTFTVGSGMNQRTLKVDSPLNDATQLQQLLPTLLDKTTTQNATELPARVNVLTAPKTVLACLPGLTEADVQSIIDSRPSTATGGQQDLAHQTPAWLMFDAKLPVDKMRALERYVTARTQVYRIQSLGYFDEGGPMSRVEAVVDTNDGKPRIIMWRDLSDLGRGYDLSKQ